MNLQNQLGNLKKFRYDEKFAQMLQLGDLQKIIDMFRDHEGPHHSQKIYKNQDQILKDKNKCFDMLHKLFLNNIGQFFTIYQHMIYQQNKNVELK